MKPTLICIIGSNKELSELWDGLVKATPNFDHLDLRAGSHGKVGSISLLFTNNLHKLTYLPDMGYKRMVSYDKKYTLNNIHHFSAFMYKVKEGLNELKIQRLEKDGEIQKEG